MELGPPMDREDRIDEPRGQETRFGYYKKGEQYEGRMMEEMWHVHIDEL